MRVAAVWEVEAVWEPVVEWELVAAMDHMELEAAPSEVEGTQ
jgi:hypothetical protein